MAVLLVVTEHSTFLTAEAVRHYESVRGRLERAAGSSVRSAHYEDVDSVQDVDAVVLSGSRAPWSAHDPRALDRLRAILGAWDDRVLRICSALQRQVRFTGGSVSTTRVTVA